VSASRTERLLNLLIALLETRTGRSKEFLRQNIQAYRDSPSEEAFERMFERDKTDLRAMGIPLEARTEAGLFEEDPGTTSYRIPKEKYRLPELRFSVQEAAVLSLSARLWGRAALGTAAARAVRKIETSGALPQEPSAEPLLEPRISTREPAFEDLLEAATARQEISFDYQGRSDAAPSARRVQPWGLGQKFGHWYLIGFDLDRQAQRVFRLSRIDGPVVADPRSSFERPADFSVSASLDSMVLPAEQPSVLLVQDGRAQALRDRAKPLPDDVGQAAQAGWDVLNVPFGSEPAFASELAGWGSRVAVRAPEGLRAAVRSRLLGVLEAATQPLPDLSSAVAGRPAARSKTTAQDHLRRLVDLVPFLVHHQGLHLDEIAAEFGITRKQLEADLSLMMVSGLPGGLHGDLMDVSWESGHVFIADAEELSEPVRFSLDEASALLVGLEALSALPGGSGDSAVRSAAAKISAAADEAAGGITGTVGVRLAAPEHAGTLALLQRAIREQKQLQLRYLVPHRDEITERTVDPQRVFSNDEAWYLQAWCHSAEAQRIFRLDRIREAALGGPVDSPEAGPGSDFPEQLFSSSAADTEVTLLLDGSARWVADYYDAQRVADLPAAPEGGRRWCQIATIRVGSVGWLPQLVAQHGGAIRVLEPADLAAETVRWTEAALGNYQE
jgi:predicted DNA-binding transcriptional regulator YafY